MKHVISIFTGIPAKPSGPFYSEQNGGKMVLSTWAENPILRTPPSFCNWRWPLTFVVMCRAKRHYFKHLHVPSYSCQSGSRGVKPTKRLYSFRGSADLHQTPLWSYADLADLALLWLGQTYQCYEISAVDLSRKIQYAIVVPASEDFLGPYKFSKNSVQPVTQGWVQW